MSKELRKTITAAFRKFSIDPHHSPLKKQKDRELAGRFIDKLHTTTFDTSLLPYYSKDGTAKGHSKAECVFAMMCDIVLSYWCTLTEPCVEDIITNKLILLDRVYKEYDQFVIQGDVKGYYLLRTPSKQDKQAHPLEINILDLPMDHPINKLMVENLPELPGLESGTAAGENE